MKFRLSKKDKKDITTALTLLTHIGITMTVCIVGCILLGVFFDKKLETSPLFLIIFILLGIASAIYSLFKITSKLWNK